MKFGGCCVVCFFLIFIVVVCIYLYILEDGLICIVKKFKRYDVIKFFNEKRFIFKNYKLFYRM